ncbi:MAG: AfsR/SARP family transcriptional regulator [Eggerthellaceae bacterium]|jgi:DNA-binding SARP family transcriptional activator
MAKLLREREVARFLVAPSGFGKSSLAFEYAETMFSFHHVFWFDCLSPCFLRDLDAGNINAEIMEADDEPGLAVFDGLPPLSAERSTNLSRVFDELMRQNCEVLVVCPPAADSFASLQHDRIKLSPHDFLLTDYEAALSHDGQVRALSLTDIRLIDRIPALRWGTTQDCELHFLEKILSEELPGDVLLAITSILLMGNGSIDLLSSKFLCCDSLLSHLARNYPYLGLNAHQDQFNAPCFAVRDILSAIRPKFEILSEVIKDKRDVDLSEYWASTLLEAGLSARACEVIEALSSSEAALLWERKHAWDLFGQVCIFEAHRLYAHACKRRKHPGGLSEAHEAWRLLALGDGNRARELATYLGFNPGEEDEARLSALVLLMRFSDEVQVQKALHTTVLILQRILPFSEKSFDWLNSLSSQNLSAWRFLALVSLCEKKSPGKLVQLWKLLQRAGGSDDICLVAGAWICEFFAQAKRNETTLARMQGLGSCLADIEALVHDQIEHILATPNLFCALAVEGLEKVRKAGLLSSERTLKSSQVLFARDTKLSMQGQQQTYHEELSREEAVRMNEISAPFEKTNFSSAAYGNKARKEFIPFIRINIFGGISVYRGAELLPPQIFKRQKSKTLLALLVISRGRERSRDELAQSLWPNSELDTARKNFYSVWSQLRRALMLPDGSCPYLCRHQKTCRLNAAYVESDYARFDEVCNRLLFGGGSAWTDLYSEIDTCFADDLMPAELENDDIVRARDNARIRLVDAMVAASERHIREGSVQQSLLYANAAIRRDPLREDAYATLMKARIAAGQRTAALETFLTCRKTLADELGIDPSEELICLYEETLQSTQTLVL